VQRPHAALARARARRGSARTANVDPPKLRIKLRLAAVAVLFAFGLTIWYAVGGQVADRPHADGASRPASSAPFGRG
jgi:hypothetical protein